MRAGSERVALYLRRAMPRVPAEAPRFAAGFYRDTLAAAEHAGFDEAIAAIDTPWVPAPGERPLPPSAPTGACDDEAWLDKSRVKANPILASRRMACEIASGGSGSWSCRSVPSRG